MDHQETLNELYEIKKAFEELSSEVSLVKSRISMLLFFVSGTKEVLENLSGEQFEQVAKETLLDVERVLKGLI